MSTLQSKLPANVQAWIAECRNAWAISSAGARREESGDGEDLPGAEHCTIKCTPDSFAVVPPSLEVKWTGINVDISDSNNQAESTDANIRLAYVIKKKPVAAMMQVTGDVDYTAFLGKLRVAKQMGNQSERFTLVLLFSTSQMHTVSRVVLSLFQKADVLFGTVPEIPDPEIEKKHNAKYAKQPVDNLHLVYYCNCAGAWAAADAVFEHSVLSSLAYGPTGSRLGWVVRPATKSRPNYVAGELNPVLPFRVW